MADPTIAAKEPSEQDLKPGTYFWCRCGNSKTQPFCDGSHKTTEFEPVEFKIEKQQRVFLCQCKRTGTQPFCDGTHKTL